MSRDFVLVTYVPFYRFHEVLKWQLLNAKRLGVDYVTAYVDNVFTKEQVASQWPGFLTPRLW